MSTLYDKNMNYSREEAEMIQLEPFESYRATCDYVTRHGSVFTVRTEEGSAQVFTYHNGNPGDVVMLSLKKSVTANYRLPVGVVESVIQYSEIIRRIA